MPNDIPQKEAGGVRKKTPIEAIASFTDDIEFFLGDLEDTPLNDSVRSDIKTALQGVRDQLNQLI